jgi:hypothetical protein
MAKTTKTRRKPAAKPPVQRKLTDREYLDASLYWPRWPMLPVVKRVGIERGDQYDGCGFLFSHSSEPQPIVYLGNVFRIGEIAEAVKSETGRDSATWGEILDKFERVEFPSLEAVLEAYRID